MRLCYSIHDAMNCVLIPAPVNRPEVMRQLLGILTARGTSFFADNSRKVQHHCPSLAVRLPSPPREPPPVRAQLPGRARASTRLHLFRIYFLRIAVRGAQSRDVPRGMARGPPLARWSATGGLRFVTLFCLYSCSVLAVGSSLSQTPSYIFSFWFPWLHPVMTSARLV